jgi:hypothetical protein
MRGRAAVSVASAYACRPGRRSPGAAGRGCTLGFGPRGGDIDSQGVVWVSLASGHIGSFDRRKCTVLNGPTATGDHCPQGSFRPARVRPCPPLSVRVLRGAIGGFELLQVLRRRRACLRLIHQGQESYFATKS